MERIADEEWDWERIRLQEGEVMVIVDQHGHPDDVTRIMTRHGGRLVAKPSPIGLFRRAVIGEADESGET
jgi:hypothetical protein